jgi:hypothetical protein
MANISVQVVNQNNVDISVTPPVKNTINVTPPATQTITIDRGAAGPPGPPGPNTIGGYGFNIVGLQPYDVLMFGGAAWENTPQTEITDGGNF